jgi:hypothetical protein
VPNNYPSQVKVRTSEATDFFSASYCSNVVQLTNSPKVSHHHQFI